MRPDFHSIFAAESPLSIKSQFVTGWQNKKSVPTSSSTGTLITVTSVNKLLSLREVLSKRTTGNTFKLHALQ